MGKSYKRSKLPSDVNRWAHKMVELSTEEATVQLPTKEQVSALMAELGRKGGKIGGKRRLETMSKEERSAVARRAAMTRWRRNEQSKRKG